MLNAKKTRRPPRRILAAHSRDNERIVRLTSHLATRSEGEKSDVEELLSHAEGPVPESGPEEGKGNASAQTQP